MPTVGDGICERAYAKVNIYLEIKGVLPNGMHSLDMIMETIDLYDDVKIVLTDGEIRVRGVENTCEKKNTAYKAAKEYFSAAGIEGFGADISITKRIPMQSGMGGGSADAAAVLKGLNELFCGKLTEAELIKTAHKVGSDVPFILKGGCARVGGTGEIITPVKDNTEKYLLLVKPELGVDTARCYSEYDRIGSFEGSADIEGCIKALGTGDLKLLKENIGNSLTKAAVSILPEIETVIGELKKNTDIAFMTGSGSTCVGIFESEEKAVSAGKMIAEKFEGAKTFAVKPKV